MRKTAKVHTNFRLPAELIEWIEARAKQNGVTKTEQISLMLEFSRQAVIEDEEEDQK